MSKCKDERDLTTVLSKATTIMIYKREGGLCSIIPDKALQPFGKVLESTLQTILTNHYPNAQKQEIVPGTQYRVILNPPAFDWSLLGFAALGTLFFLSNGK